MTADVASPDTKCARPTTPADEPLPTRNRSVPLEGELNGQTQPIGHADGANTGDQTSARARSASRSHSCNGHHAGHTAHVDDPHANDAQATAAVDEGEQADIKRPPHTPVERPRPPDNADKVVRARKVKVEAEVSRRSREVEAEVEGAAAAHARPIPSSAEDSAWARNEACNVTTVPTRTTVEPDDQTATDGAAHAHAIDQANEDVEGAPPDARIEGESGRDGRIVTVEVARWSVLMRGRSATQADKVDQRPPPPRKDDVPDRSPRPPVPLKAPDKSLQRWNGDGQAEREGERSGHSNVSETRSSVETAASGAVDGDDDSRRRPNELSEGPERVIKGLERRLKPNVRYAAQIEPTATEVEADASGAAGHVDEPKKRPSKLYNASEQVSQRLERQVESYSPEMPQVKRIGPNGEADASGASRGVEGSWDKLTKLRKALEQVHERLQRPVRSNSPNTPQPERTVPNGKAEASGASGGIEGC